MKKTGMNFLGIMGVLLFLSPLSANAACTNPAGVEGNQVYNTTHKVMQYCDGTTWISMKGGVGSGTDTLSTLSCTDGQVAKWNNGGGVWECAADNAGGGAETDPEVGALTAGDWCRANGAGTAIICDRPTPITSESDPQVGGMTANRVCRANGTGTAVVCNLSAGFTGSCNPSNAVQVSNGIITSCN